MDLKKLEGMAMGVFEREGEEGRERVE